MVLFDVAFWFIKYKAIVLSFQDFLPDPYLTSRDLQGRNCTSLTVQVSSKICHKILI